MDKNAIKASICCKDAALIAFLSIIQVSIARTYGDVLLYAKPTMI